MLEPDNIPPAIAGGILVALFHILKGVVMGHKKGVDPVQDALYQQLHADNAILTRHVERLDREVIMLKLEIKKMQENANLLWLSKGGHDS